MTSIFDLRLIWKMQKSVYNAINIIILLLTRFNSYNLFALFRVFIFVSPAVSRGDTSPSSVRPSVRPSVRTSHFSRHTSLTCNNPSSTYTIEMKLHTWIDLGERKRYVQDPYLWHQYYWSYYPLSIFWKCPGRWHMCTAEHPILVVGLCSL